MRILSTSHQLVINQAKNSSTHQFFYDSFIDNLSRNGHSYRHGSTKAPSLSISLHLEPPIYKITDPTVPTLSIHANLDAAQPITVCTWHTILHPRQALQQDCFEIIDKATNLPVPQQSKKNKRPAIMRQYGTPYEPLFVTLTPQSPYTIQTPFGPSPLSPSAGQMQERTDPLSTQEPVYGVRGLKKGD